MCCNSIPQPCRKFYVYEVYVEFLLISGINKLSYMFTCYMQSSTTPPQTMICVKTCNRVDYMSEQLYWTALYCTCVPNKVDSECIINTSICQYVCKGSLLLILKCKFLKNVITDLLAIWMQCSKL